MPVASLLLDDKDRIVRANPEASGLLHLDGGVVAGSNLDDVIHSDDPTWSSADPVDRLGAPSIGREVHARVGGRRVRLRVTVYPLGETGEPGEPSDSGAGRLVTLRDADGDKSDPGEEQDYKSSVEELCACVAHEIRNPLTGIRTTVQFVTSKLVEGDPHAEDLSAVLKEMDRIEEIIGDLLRFGRPAESSLVKADLNALIGRVLDSMEPQCREAEVEVRRKLSPELGEFLFSPDNIQQVLLNLARNAIEAMPEGGRLKFTTAVRRFRSQRPPEAEIYVSDTGHGIPQDLLDDVFKPFFTTRHNGTGLGLPISLGIVRAHGGRMTARNRVRGGVIFRISLPLEQSEDPA